MMNPFMKVSPLCVLTLFLLTGCSLFSDHTTPTPNPPKRELEKVADKVYDYNEKVIRHQEFITHTYDLAISKAKSF